MMFIGSLVLLLALTTIDAQNECPDRNAICVNIRDCPEIISILRGPKPLPAEALQTVRNFQCGFDGSDPKVCCRQIHRMPLSFVRNKNASSLWIVENVPDPPDVSNHPNLRLLDYGLCGPITWETCVASGNKTGIAEYPWMALIAYDTGRSTPEFRCAGTIISSRYILTAAHCVTSLPSGLRVIGARVGDHDLSTERDCDRNNVRQEMVCAERYQDFGVDGIYFHPDYSKTKMQNDIALIRLNSTVDFTPDTVRPICLPYGTAANLSHNNARVTGWGATEFGQRSQYLLQARVPLKTNSECKEIYKRTTQIWYKQMCAGGEVNVESCYGDGGEPLQANGVINGNSVRTIQHGVLSYAIKYCFAPGFPGVYTRVAYYMDWILDTMTD